MEFSSLVLMERDKETNGFVREVGSYEVSEGATYVTKFYTIDNEVYVYFDTERDVEEWEFSAIFDLFDLNMFEAKGYNIEEVDNEYNPTWVIKFPFLKEHEDMKEKINDLCNIIEETMEKVFSEIKDKKEEYV